MVPRKYPSFREDGFFISGVFCQAVSGAESNRAKTAYQRRFNHKQKETSMEKNLAKNYDPKDFEERIYNMWERKRLLSGQKSIKIKSLSP